MSWVAISDPFKYLCYGTTTTINIFPFTVRGSPLESDVYRRQILTSKVDPRAERVPTGSLAISSLCCCDDHEMLGNVHSIF